MGSPRTKVPDSAIALAAAAVIDGMSYEKAAIPLGIGGARLKDLMRRRGHHTPTRQRHAVPIVMPTDRAHLGYMAGIFDGEGSLSRAAGRHGRWALAIYSTTKPLIDWLLLFGGLYYFRGADQLSSPLSRKPQYGWNLSRAADQIVFLRTLIPILIIKAELAAVAIPEMEEYIRTLAGYPRHRRGRPAAGWSAEVK